MRYLSLPLVLIFVGVTACETTDESGKPQPTGPRGASTGAPPRCGDLHIDAGEVCDDGGNTDGDGCSATCQGEPGFACTASQGPCFPICGDGMIVSGETCDDGNPSDDDGCSSDCETEAGWSCSGAPSTCSGECGNGVVTRGEECDDANSGTGDGCFDCQLELGWTCAGNPSECGICGDGAIEGAETCDDDGTAPGDGCGATCRIELGWRCSGAPSVCELFCGDGIIAPGEECDDGNEGDGDGCSSTCAREAADTCGNDVINALGEQCDGATWPGGAQPTGATCVDCLLDFGVEADCDSVDDDDDDVVDEGCAPEWPGDVSEWTAYNFAYDDLAVGCSGERYVLSLPPPSTQYLGAIVCDPPTGYKLFLGERLRGVFFSMGDRSGSGEDHCTLFSDSPVVSVWNASNVSGNLGYTRNQAGEDFVFGSMGSGSYTPGSYTCGTTIPGIYCGDGSLQTWEECDDGGVAANDACDPNCRTPGCGNGYVGDDEGCDDGNSWDGDGCDSNCQPTGCNNGVVVAPETCEDGNLLDGDGCDSNCTWTGCNNGIVTSGEECDDGSWTNGDGCDNNCTTSRCGNGETGAPESCDDGNDTPGDGCENDCTDTGCPSSGSTGTACDDRNASTVDDYCIGINCVGIDTTLYDFVTNSGFLGNDSGIYSAWRDDLTESACRNQPVGDLERIVARGFDDTNDYCWVWSNRSPNTEPNWGTAWTSLGTSTGCSSSSRPIACDPNTSNTQGFSSVDCFATSPYNPGDSCPAASATVVWRIVR